MLKGRLQRGHSRRAGASSKAASRRGSSKWRAGRGARGPPKRALGAYIFFSKDYHARVSAENPNIPFADVGRILGSRWQKMSDKDKKPYIKKAEADKKRFEKELKRSKR